MKKGGLFLIAGTVQGDFDAAGVAERERMVGLLRGWFVS